MDCSLAISVGVRPLLVEGAGVLLPSARAVGTRVGGEGKIGALVVAGADDGLGSDMVGPCPLGIVGANVLVTVGAKLEDLEGDLVENGNGGRVGNSGAGAKFASPPLLPLVALFAEKISFTDSLS